MLSLDSKSIFQKIPEFSLKFPQVPYVKTVFTSYQWSRYILYRKLFGMGLFFQPGTNKLGYCNYKLKKAMTQNCFLTRF